MTLTPYQLPNGTEEIDGKRFITFNNPDTQIVLFCRPQKNDSALYVHIARSYDYNEKTEDWDIEEDIDLEAGIRAFEFRKVVNPLTGRVSLLKPLR